jgi:hypothetical protein
MVILNPFIVFVFAAIGAIGAYIGWGIASMFFNILFSLFS